MYAVLLTTALLAGSLLAVQAAANLQLTKAVGTPYGAATLQLGLAAGLLFALALAAGAVGALRLVGDVPAWQLLGGLASPLYITTGILLFPRLGAVATVGLFVTGQVLASLGLDLFGWFGLDRAPLGAGLLLGAAAVLVGITMIIRGQPPAAGRAPAATAPVRTAARTRQPLWLALGVLAGAGLPVQGAINAQLRAALDQPLAVGAISFAVATLAIGAVLVALLAVRATPAPAVRPLARMPWWGWLGGGCAAAYVTATFLLLPTIGAATTVALTVTGQQLASAVIDRNGLFRMPRRVLGPARLAGVGLLVAGSAAVQFA
ncbi:MAG TPA: DMT family transporter [Natronosporangium sp.]